jgi:hypothetical protein
MVNIASPRSKILKLPDIVAVPKAAENEENPFQMPLDSTVFSMRENDKLAKRQAKQKMNMKSIYEKHQVKGKNFKTLLAEDEDDVQFYQNLRKRDVDKVMMTRQTRGIKR